LDEFNKVTRLLLEKAEITNGMIFEPGINGSDSDYLELHRMGVARNIDFRLASHGVRGLSDILKKNKGRN